MKICKTNKLRLVPWLPEAFHACMVKEKNSGTQETMAVSTNFLTCLSSKVALLKYYVALEQHKTPVHFFS